MVEAIQDQWVIAAGVAVLVGVSAWLWATRPAAARRRAGDRPGMRGG